MEAYANADTSKDLIADLDARRGRLVESVDEAGSDDCEDCADDEKWGVVADGTNYHARQDSEDGWMEGRSRVDGEVTDAGDLLLAMTNARFRISLSTAERPSLDGLKVDGQVVYQSELGATEADRVSALLYG